MSDQPASYWFPAKRYGWGWGLPRTWEGWFVLVAYACSMSVGLALQSRLSQWVFIAFIAAVNGGLIWICGLKGEPPAWRWGKR
ncbi:MAG: hypothetical protein EKK53_16715 [Burkholderiales bacterium]|nr:MAG: hypothetical protein EKK53_16715 [Burkholderiales bacterium]